MFSSDEIKKILDKEHLSSEWLRYRLSLRGVKVDKSSLSLILTGKRISVNVINNSMEILLAYCNSFGDKYDSEHD